ncbi:MAG: filamentous hemagglutinin N-terminal domain-containing protein, partial [Chlorobiaceae bacterium]|nr:filamentous hemagglutinin N-terminal domain-containing protein [Chlorobiaceae bacterium]
KIIWSAIKEKWIVVSEKAGTHGVPVMKSGALSIAALMTLGTSAWALDPGALPTGGVISAGSGLISTNGSAMTVTQTSQRMVADWQSFNIGEQAAVNFVQPGANAAALNRIHDLNPSQIMGQLSSNGQVFLLNHAGIVFGKTAQVNVGSLVATSLDMADSDFMAGSYALKNGAGAGSVLNQGSIETGKGGVVALIAPKVTNEGTVKAEGGSALLASGNRVTVDFGGDGLISYVIDQGAVDAQVSNSGLIRTDGGMAVMTAEAADALTTAVVNNTGLVEARTLGNRSGKIVLLSDMEQGVTTVGGKLDASAPDGGDGGFIETSGGRVKIGEDAVIDTHATNGKTGHWLIDPVDFTIATSGGDITGTQLGNLLGQNDVTIQTATGTDTDTIQYGASGSNGDIFVNDKVSWSANHTLTLNAYRNISINKNITATGSSGKVVLLYGQGSSDGTISGTQANYTLAPGAKINLQAGQNFSTKLGSGGTQIDYQVINALGNAGDANNAGNYTLQGLAHSSMLSGYYALGANIDASATQNWNLGAGFKPIGNNSNYFTGNFDGLGHTITGLTINRPTETAVGFFGNAYGHGSGGELRNVGFIGGSVTGSGFVGSLAGVINHTNHVVNCFATGSVTGNGDNDWIGGLIGYNYGGVVLDSYATGPVYNSGSSSFVGGLVGYSGLGGREQNCYATGSVTGLGDNVNVGGLIGFKVSGSITNCYATGAVTGIGSDVKVGGLIGEGSYFMNNVESCYATGAVTGTGDNAFTGGLVGKINLNASNQFINCFWDTLTTHAASGIGNATRTGVVGKTTNELMSQSTYTSWDFTGTWWMMDGSTRPFLRSEWSETISNAHQLQMTAMDLGAAYILADDIDMGAALSGIGTSYPGMWGSAGFMSIGDYGSPFHGTFDGQGHTISGLTVNRPDTDFVGLFGAVGYGGSVKNLGLVDCSLTGKEFVGSIVGVLTGGGAYSSPGSVSHCFATGSVKGTSSVGGLVGLSYGGEMHTSFADCTVTGENYVGGLIGQNGGTVDECYAAGPVSGTTKVGGLAGSSSYVITHSFWNKNTTGQTSSAGDETGLSDTQMKQSSYFAAAGWDISSDPASGSTWFIYEGQSAPLLSALLTPLTITYSGTTRTVTYDGTSYLPDATYSLSNVDTSNLNGYVNAGDYLTPYIHSTRYLITTAGTPGTLTILQKELTLSGLTAGNRDYNATTSATISNWGTLQGIVSGDTVNLTHSSALAAFSDANAGTGKTVTVTGLTLDNTNYRISSQTTTADISQADITVSVSDSGKTYDGTVSATGTPALISGTLYGTDRITGVTAAYENPNTGTGKRVLVTGVTVSDGNSGQNYNVTLQDSSNGIINRAPLAVKASDDRKMFDGKAYEGGNGVQYSGFVNGETASVLSGSLVYGGTSQGAVRSGRYAITPGGLGSGNYAIEWQDGELRIDPAIDEPKQVSRTVPTIASDAVPGTATPMPVLSLVSSDPFAGIPGGITVRIVASPSGAQQGVVRVSVPKDQAGLGATFDIPLPASLFDAGGSASVEMTLADGGRLPQWLSYDSRNRLMKAVDVPPGAMPLTLLVRQDGVSWTMEISAKGVDHALAMGGGR